MAADDLNAPRVIRIPASAEETHVVIHDATPVVQGRPVEKKDVSKRGFVSMVTGGITGAIAWIASHFYSQDKMLPYEAEYQKRSVDMIMGKGGMGAAAAESGLGMGAHPVGLVNGGFGNLGPGMSGALIENSVATNMLLENPEKYSFAKWMRRFGGKSNFNMAVGVGVGAAVGLATYAMMGKDEKPAATTTGPEGKDWASKVEASKDEPRSIN